MSAYKDVDAAYSLRQLIDAVRTLTVPLPPTPALLSQPSISLDKEATRYTRFVAMMAQFGQSSALDDDNEITNEILEAERATLLDQNLRLPTGEYAGGQRKNVALRYLNTAVIKAGREGKPYYVFAKSSPASRLEKGMKYVMTENFRDWEKYNYKGSYIGWEIMPSGLVRSIQSAPALAQKRLEVAEGRVALDVFRSYNSGEANNLAAVPELVDSVANDLKTMGGAGAALANEVIHFLDEHQSLGGVGVDPQLRQRPPRITSPLDSNMTNAKTLMDKNEEGQGLQQTCENLLVNVLPSAALKERKLAGVQVVLDWVKSLPEIPAIEQDNFADVPAIKAPVHDPIFKEILLHMRFVVPLVARVKYALAYLTRLNRSSKEGGSWQAPLVSVLESMREDVLAEDSRFKPTISKNMVNMYLGKWKEEMTVDQMANLELSLVWDSIRGEGDAPIGGLPTTFKGGQLEVDLKKRIIPVMLKNEPQYKEMYAYLLKKQASKIYNLEAYELNFVDKDLNDSNTGELRGDEESAGGGTIVDGVVGGRVFRRIDLEKRYADSGVNLIRHDVSAIPENSLLSGDYAEPLRQHQRDGVNKMLDTLERAKGFILGDGTGAGKTMQELAAALHYSDQGKKVLIVTEKIEIFNDAFVKDMGRFGEDAVKRLVWFPKVGLPIEEGLIYCCSYNQQWLRQVMEVKWDVLIFDEIHNLKNQIARTPSTRSLLAMEMMANADKVIGASATPMDKPMHIAYMCDMFGLNKGEQMAKMGQVPDSLSGWKRHPRVTAEQEIEAIEDFFDDMSAKGLMVKREVSMSKIDFISQPVAMPTDYQKIFDKLDERFARLFAAARGLAKALIKAHWLMTQRRVLDIAKVDQAGYEAVAHLKKGYKVVVFAASVEDAGTINELLEVEHGSLGGHIDQARGEANDVDAEIIDKLRTLMGDKASTGRITEIVRQAGFKAKEMTSKSKDGKNNDIVNEFQNGLLDCIVTTPQSGGTGINLDDTQGPERGGKPRAVILTQPPFTGNDVVQMLGRVNRLATVTRSKVVQLVIEDNHVDQWNVTLVTKKLERLGAAVSGDYAAIDLSKVADMDNGEIARYLVESGVPENRPVITKRERKRKPRGGGDTFQVPEGQADAVMQLEMLGEFRLRRLEDYMHLVQPTFFIQGAYPNPRLDFGANQGQLMFDDWNDGLTILSLATGEPKDTLSRKIRQGAIVMVPEPADMPESKDYLIVKVRGRNQDWDDLMVKYKAILAPSYQGWKIDPDDWESLKADCAEYQLFVIRGDYISEKYKRKTMNPSKNFPMFELF